MSETTTRPKRRTLHATVVSAERLTPHMVRVVFSGDELDGFAAGEFTDHYVKLQLPPPGAAYAAPFDPEEIKAQPAARAVAAHAHLHGPRVGRRAQPAHARLRRPRRRAASPARGPRPPSPATSLQLTGPGGAYTPDPDAAWHLMVGDLSVLPAIGASLQRMPAGVPVHVLVEVDDEADRQALTQPGRPARDLAARRRHATRVLVDAVARARRSPPGRSTRSCTARRRPCAPCAATCWSTASVAPEAISVSGYWKRTRTEEGWREDKAEWNRLAEQDVDLAWTSRDVCCRAVAKNEHPQASIDWASAEVRGGDLDRRAGRRAEQRVGQARAGRRRAPRAAGSAWGATKVTKAAVTVEAVTAGAEEDLRHLLDGAVQQANADFAPDDEGDAGDEPLRGGQRDDRGLPVLRGTSRRGRPARGQASATRSQQRERPAQRARARRRRARGPASGSASPRAARGSRAAPRSPAGVSSTNERRPSCGSGRRETRPAVLEVADGLRHRLRAHALGGGEVADARRPLAVEPAEHGELRRRAGRARRAGGGRAARAVSRSSWASCARRRLGALHARRV